MEVCKLSILGDRLKEEREKRGWSQVFVAKKLGLKRSSTYANWEYGIREPDLEMIKKLSELYETSLDKLSGNIIREDITPYYTNKEEQLKQEVKKLAEMIINLPDDERKLVENMIKKLQQKN